MDTIHIVGPEVDDWLVPNREDQDQLSRATNIVKLLVRIYLCTDVHLLL